MGYTGCIIFNGESILNEWKEENTQHCFNYALEYAKSKDCLLTESSINETIKFLFGSSGMHYKFMRGMNGVLNIKKALFGLLSSRYVPVFNNDNEFILVAKKEESDESGNSSVINFYKKDRCPTMEKDRYGHYTKEQHETIKNNRFCFLDSCYVYFMLDALGLANKQKIFEFEERIIGIKDVTDILILIEELKEIHITINKKYIESLETMMIMANILDELLEKIKKGNKIFVIYENGRLVFKNTTTLENIEYIWDDFFFISSLFKENHINPVFCRATITTKKELEVLISKFKDIKIKSTKIEYLLKDIYQKSTEEPFSLVIDGGY